MKSTCKNVLNMHFYITKNEDNFMQSVKVYCATVIKELCRPHCGNNSVSLQKNKCDSRNQFLK